MIYNVLANLAKSILTYRNRMDILNHHYIPNEPFIVTCSHKGWVDVVALGVSLYPKQIHFMAKKELFETIWTKKFLTSLNAFPVNRSNPGPNTIKIPVNRLKEGKIIGIFPSGTRTEEDVPLKRGAVTIANLAKVPIVPAAYKGPTNLKGILRGEKVQIIFGEPIDFSKKLKKEELQIETKRLTNIIQQLELSLN